MSQRIRKLYTYPVHLQFFAQEKTEKATPKKRKESRDKGQVANSSEVPTALILLFVFICLFFVGGWMTSKLLTIYTVSFSEYARWDVTQVHVATIFQQVSFEAAIAVFPVMIAAVVAGIIGNYVQVGFLFTGEPLKPKLEKINPLKGFKRIFSIRAIVELLKSVFKIILISTVVSAFLWTRKEELFLLSQKSVAQGLQLVGSITFQIALVVAIILLFLSILDYLYQKYDFEKNIRMSKQDIKDEYKKTEGDPLIKAKIKERQREMAMRRMMQEVPRADVVITNPTHYAIALVYDATNMDAPTIVAKGVDHVAKRIREIAEEHQVLIMENKPLARALYDQVELGEAVPEHLFKAVAEILAYVYRVKGKV